MRYKYTVDQKEYTSQSDVSRQFWDAHPQGSAVTVQLTRLAPTFSTRVEADGGNLPGLLGFVLLWVIIWDGIMFFLFYAFWEPYLRSRWLCKNGTPTIGTVTGFEEVRGKSTWYYVLYKFTGVDRSAGPPTEQTFDGKMQVSKKQEDEVKPGQTVTVLYDPDKPAKNIIYRFGSFKAA